MGGLVCYCLSVVVEEASGYDGSSMMHMGLCEGAVPAFVFTMSAASQLRPNASDRAERGAAKRRTIKGRHPAPLIHPPPPDPS
jgi:hypothetical protein